MQKKTSEKKTENLEPVDSDHGKQILHSLRRIIRSIDIYSRMLAHDYQITGPQLACLLAVVEKGSLTATEISKKISLSASTVIGVIDRLEAKGLVMRERDKKDRRVIHVHSTHTGREMIAKMPYPLKQPLNNALSQLSEKDQKTIASSLALLVKLMEADSVSADPLLEPARFTKI